MAQQTEQMRCNQCEAAMVTYGGETAFCHEAGCPNQKKTWVADRGEWVRFVECRECGCDVEAGEMCGCAEEMGGEASQQDERDALQANHEQAADKPNLAYGFKISFKAVR
jgi:hypothetical protein